MFQRRPKTKGIHKQPGEGREKSMLARDAELGKPLTVDSKRDVSSEIERIDQTDKGHRVEKSDSDRKLRELND